MLQKIGVAAAKMFIDMEASCAGLLPATVYLSPVHGQPLDVHFHHNLKEHRPEAVLEPILLLHGFAGCWQHWLHTAVQLHRHFPLIIPDLIGFGESATPTRGVSYTIEQQAKWIIQFMDALGIRRAHFVGNSMGGWLAQYLAINYPARVGSLVLINAAGIRGDVDSDMYQRFDEGDNPLLDASTSFDGLMESFTHELPRLAFVAKPYFAKKHKELLPVYRKSFNDFWFAPPELPIEQITCPVLVLWGDKDSVIDVTVGENTFAQIGSERKSFAMIEDAGHLPMIEKPYLVARAMDMFYRGTGWFIEKKRINK